ncbi:MAG TPA: universal stress protein [Pirellulales bacterium]|jgi:nucleotide-binding universal stress UspA family protein|nr:universal stress protein [Pirellulales bacterium]
MIELRKILVPTDFSDTSAVALTYAKELATAFKASIHLLHVMVEWLPDGFVPYSPELFRDIEQAAHKQLGEILSAEEQQQYQAQLVVRSGSSEFIEILHYAREQAVDLIVIGTHGRGPIAHMLLGSVAEKVVRKASCPVLTVRHPEHEFVHP